MGEIPAAVAPVGPSPDGLRIAFLVYRGNPRCGGQGVYTRHLTRELVQLGHSVEVFAGQPWPVLDEGVGFTPVPSLDLYREPDPFRVPGLGEFRSWPDVLEFAVMCTAGFPEPRTFSLRARRLLAARRRTGGRPDTGRRHQAQAGITRPGHLHHSRGAGAYGVGRQNAVRRHQQQPVLPLEIFHLGAEAL